MEMNKEETKIITYERDEWNKHKDNDWWER